MHVTGIKLINFKNIGEFQQEFTKGIYLVTGENDKGKSHLINSIISGLTGTRSANLLKQGAEKGSIEINIGSDKESKYKVELRFSEANPRGTLYITDLESGMQSQKLSQLQTMFQYTDFDAHEFTLMSNTADGRKRQVEIVKNLLDPEILEQIKAIELKLPALEEDRLQWGRNIKSIEGSILEANVTPEQIEFFDKEIDPKAILDQINKAHEHNQTHATNYQKMEDLGMKIDDWDDIVGAKIADFQEREIDIEVQITEKKDRIRDLQIEIDGLNKSIEKKAEEQKIIASESKAYQDNADQEFKKLNKEFGDIQKVVDATELIDISILQRKSEEATDHNKMVFRVNQVKDKQKKLKAAVLARKEIVDNIAKLKTEKSQLIAGAKLPIEGLSFDDTGLSINGVPVQQGEISTSQEIDIAAKLIIAMNPKMKVFKMMNGESIGTEKFKAIVEFAKANGYQGFIEEMHRGQDDLRVEKYTEV